MEAWSGVITRNATQMNRVSGSQEKAVELMSASYLSNQKGFAAVATAVAAFTAHFKDKMSPAGFLSASTWKLP